MEAVVGCGGAGEARNWLVLWRPAGSITLLLAQGQHQDLLTLLPAQHRSEEQRPGWEEGVGDRGGGQWKGPFRL